MQALPVGSVALLAGPYGLIRPLGVVAMAMVSVASGAGEELASSGPDAVTTAEGKRLLQRSMVGRVEFPGGTRVRLTYGFGSPEELGDWVEYPPDAGRGEWRIEDGGIVGQGRIGLVHPWRFAGDFTVRLSYRNRPRGRLHLFDNGKGRGLVETDFRALYLRGQARPEKLGWRGPSAAKDAGTTRVEFKLSKDERLLTVGNREFRVPPVEGERRGQFGIFAWGESNTIDSLEIESSVCPAWAASEVRRLAAIANIESRLDAAARSVALLDAVGSFAWPWTGPNPLKEGRGGEVLLEAGEEPTTIAIGSRFWKDYRLEGWLRVPAATKVRFRGRHNPRRLRSGFSQMEFRPMAVTVSSHATGARSERNIPLEALRPDTPVRFRIEWFGGFVAAELQGQQVLRSAIAAPAQGCVELRLDGAGARVGGLKLTLLSGPKAGESGAGAGRDGIR